MAEVDEIRQRKWGLIGLGKTKGLRVIDYTGVALQKFSIRLTVCFGASIARFAAKPRCSDICSRKEMQTMGQWRKSLQRWVSSAAILTFALLAPTRAAAQGNSDFGQSHKPSDPGNSDFGQSHKPSDPGISDFDQSPGSVPTPEPATLTLLALGSGAAALGARFRKDRRK